MMPTRSEIWWQHARSPLLVFIPLAAMLATTSIDRLIAHTLFFDAQRVHWIGASSWWVNDIVHSGGRWAIRIVVATAMTLWIASFRSPRLRLYRRPGAYLALATVLAVGIVGALKTITNVHCPWDLQEFGGNIPYVDLFASRSATLPPGRCFPAAHASSGYALLALYFVFRERGIRLARLGLAVGTITGLLFGIAQQSRGAHFVSHDVWSAFLVWMVSLTLYASIFKCNLWNPLD